MDFIIDSRVDLDNAMWSYIFPVGVKVEKSGGVQDLYSRLIISDAGIPNTFCNLLPPEIAQKSS